MLSRVAERVYWAGRYIERAEDIARLVDVHSQLMLDLPREAGVAWPQAMEIIGLDQPPGGHGEDTERDMLKLLLTDESSQSSLISTIAMARENFRTTRDIVPAEAWQSVNELHLFARSQLRWAVGQRRRHDILREIVARVQQLRGLLNDTMSHGLAYHFLQIGTFIERADMCSRVIDVAVASLLSNRGKLEQYDNTLWMSTLRSVSGYQMYQQYVRRRIRGPEVLSFLFQDPAFPRSIRHCLQQLQNCLENLPRGKAVRQKLQAATNVIAELAVANLDNAALHAEVDRLQLALADLNQQMTDAWFLPGEQMKKKQPRLAVG
jgi:uncharacterized alpha-E superfamily protein